MNLTSMIRLKNLGILLTACIYTNVCLAQFKDESNQLKSIKSIKTKTYEAAPNFNKADIENPEYALLILSNVFDYDLSWKNKEYDKYGNLIYEEKLSQNQLGEEFIDHKINYKYYSESEGVLSTVETENLNFDGLSTFEKKKYLRDSDGKLLEIQITENDELKEKSIYMYDQNGQVKKIEIYKKDGLDAIKSYEYDSVNTDLVIRYTYQDLVENYEEIYDYIYNINNELVTCKMQYFEAGSRRYERLRNYYDYQNGTATKIEYYDGSETILELDTMGNIVKHIYHSEDVGYDRLSSYSFEYEYNERNDWVRLLITHNPHSPSYHVSLREIKYHD